MSSIEIILQRLEEVQRSGPGWRARCPACGGKSRKLSLSEADDGRVLLHCFAGCEAAAVVQAVGLTIGDLFPERLAPDTSEERRRRQRLAREAQWSAALDSLAVEGAVLLFAAEAVVAGAPIISEDFARLELAIQRIDGARSVLREEPRCSREQGVRLPRERAA